MLEASAAVASARTRRSRVLPALAVIVGTAVALLGVAAPAHADPGTISGAIQFPAGMDAPDLAEDLEGNGRIASFDRGDDEITYEVVGVDDANTHAITTVLTWDVDSSQLRWTLVGATSPRYTFFVFWKRWVYTGPIPHQVDAKQFWLSSSSTTMLEDIAQATVYTVGTSPTQFHCAYGYEGCAAGGGGNTPAVVAGTPTISGTARVGEQLSVSAGAWQPAAANLGYQWLRDGRTIANATVMSYVPTAADVGMKLSVKVTGSLTGYTTAAATSAPTKAVARGELAAPTPKISGTAKVGKTLTAKAGKWKPAGVKLSYQWYANGKKIAKATRSTYQITKAVKGKKITVKVTGAKVGYRTVTKASAATKQVTS
jgi:hypothetical protein